MDFTVKEVQAAVGGCSSSLIRKLVQRKVLEAGEPGTGKAKLRVRGESLEEIAAKIKTAAPRTGFKKAAAGKVPATLPTSKDLYRPEEAAKAAGISVGTLYKFLKDSNHILLKNGRSSYVPKAAVEAARAKFRKPEPVVTAPRASSVPSVLLSAKPDPRIDRIEQELLTLGSFVRAFAKSCGFDPADGK
jgi:hypothetical protein